MHHGLALTTKQRRFEGTSVTVRLAIAADQSVKSLVFTYPGNHGTPKKLSPISQYLCAVDRARGFSSVFTLFDTLF